MGNTPNIRFSGFTDDWEQRKLGEICERVTRKNKNGESDLPLTIASQYGLIDQRDFFNKVVAAKDMSNYYLLKKGEFAYNKSYSKGYDYGSIKRLNAYEQGCLSTLYICFAITSDDIESDYLECYFDTLKWYGDVSQICAEGARNHGLLNVDTKAFFDEVTIEMPSSKEEQRKISAYLNNLDNLITLHQRKCDEVKELKKYMLQKMFPKNGERIPEIRFSGFTDAWEQRKLGEMSSSFEYGLNAASKEYDGTNKYIRITDIDDNSREFSQEDVTSPDTDLSKAEGYKLSEGDILFARTGASVGKSYIYRASDGLVYYAGFLIRAKIKPEYNPEFVFQNTLTSDYEKFIKVTSMRSGQPGVNAQEYSQFEIYVPSKAEQDKIATYFRNLDNLITLHQRKCDELKEVKKYMLQNMFPKKG